MKTSTRAVVGFLCILVLHTTSGLSEAPDDFSKNSRAYLRALSGNDDRQLEAAITRVTADNSPRAVNLLFKGLRTPNKSHYWLIIAGLSKFSSRDAISTIVKEILSGKDTSVRRDLIMSLRLNDTSLSTDGLIQVIREGSLPSKVAALDELIDRKHIPIISVLVEIASNDPRETLELNRRVYKAIYSLTHERPLGPPSNWRAWWNDIKDKYSGEGNTQGNTPDQPDKSHSSKPRVGKTLIESLHQTRITDFLELRKGKQQEIVIIQGANDSVEEVLSSLEIPHVVMTSDALRSHELKACTALFVNCGSIGWPTKLITKIRDYVANGGYLFATDVAIVDVVNRAFPGYIRTGRASFPDLTVDILPWRGSTGHPYLRGVNIPLTGSSVEKATGRMTWIIDAGGPSIDFDPRRVVPLIEAPSLQRRKAPTAVGVTFRYGVDLQLYPNSIQTGGVYEELSHLGGGSVLCVISHFKKQKSGEDGFALQNLLINFLIEAKDRSPFIKKQ